uniref:Similar to Callose synthase 3 n=1 Tax=Arundo donax TaxID=35708 RepID=A0A0A8YQ16_ARUDO
MDDSDQYHANFLYLLQDQSDSPTCMYRSQVRS